MEDTVIDIRGLTKTYNGVKAVDGLTLRIRKGEIFGLLGPNGAGKSTTILMLLGLSEPDSGELSVLGINPTRNPIPVKQRVGYLPDDVGFYDDRSGLDNLILTARLNGMSDDEAYEKALRLLDQVGLSHAARKKAGAYSRGMRQRLGLADVLIKSPEIIILDEPTLGIDPTGVEELLGLIRNLSREQQLTVLLSSHQLHQVQQICDRVGLFVKGKLLADGTVAELSRKLFEDEPFQITAALDHVPEGLAERLTMIPGVRQLSLSPQESSFAKNPSFSGESSELQSVVLSCSSDCAPAIAQAIVDSGASLYALSRREYGLDEIYRRYFAGGEFHGAKQAEHAE